MKKQKQHIIDIMKADEELGLYEETKQETLEEAIERLSNIVGVGGISDKHAFMLGTFWQQSESYRSM